MPVQLPDNQKGDQGGVRIILAMTNFKYSLDFFPTKHDEPVGVDDNTLWGSMSTADALSASFRCTFLCITILPEIYSVFFSLVPP